MRFSVRLGSPRIRPNCSHSDTVACLFDDGPLDLTRCCFEGFKT